MRIWDLSASGRAAQEAAAGAGASGSGSTMLAAGPSELELAPIGTAESPNPPAGKSKAGKTANSVTGVVFLAGDRCGLGTGVLSLRSSPAVACPARPGCARCHLRCDLGTRHNRCSTSKIQSSARLSSLVQTNGMLLAPMTLRLTLAIRFCLRSLVASSNASESAVKIWDRRNLDRPLALLNRTGLARPRGVTSLTLDPSEGSDRLAASYSDSVVCVWRASSAAADGEPEACLKGHKSSSFYVKARAAQCWREGPGIQSAASRLCGLVVSPVFSAAVTSLLTSPLHPLSFQIAFSPDGTHIASGSCDYGLYVWQIARPADPPFVLRGHGREVDGVDWCRTDFGCLASCGDDSTVRVWAIRRPADTARALLCAAARAPARRCLCDLPRESHAAAVSGVVSYARLYLTTSR